MKKLLQSLLVLTLTIGFTTFAYAQPSDQITATTTVDASLNVTGTQDLNFGTLSAGATSDIGITDAGAGQFTVSGNSGSVDLSFSFTNGGELVADGASGNDGDNIPITFDASDAAWGPDASTQTGTWNPETGSATGVDIAADGDRTIYVFIGGSITAASDQIAGTYTETIKLTATHN
jgi:hypothetical protein